MTDWLTTLHSVQIELRELAGGIRHLRSGFIITGNDVVALDLALLSEGIGRCVDSIGQAINAKLDGDMKESNERMGSTLTLLLEAAPVIGAGLKATKKRGGGK